MGSPTYMVSSKRLSRTERWIVPFFGFRYAFQCETYEKKIRLHWISLDISTKLCHALSWNHYDVLKVTSKVTWFAGVRGVMAPTIRLCGVPGVPGVVGVAGRPGRSRGVPGVRGILFFFSDLVGVFTQSGMVICFVRTATYKQSNIQCPISNNLFTFSFIIFNVLSNVTSCFIICCSRSSIRVVCILRRCM